MTSTLRTKLLKGNASLRKSFEANYQKRNLALAMRSMRKMAGLTQIAVAKRSGLSQSHISKIESATGKMPQPETLQKYADACGATAWIEFRPKGKQPELSDGCIAVAEL